MKYWLIWLLGIVTGMQILALLRDNNSILLQLSGIFTSILGGIGIVISVVLNVVVVVAVLSQTWDIKL